MRSIKIDLPNKIDPIEWLSSYNLYPKFYWKPKASDIEIATLGQELKLSDINDIDNSEHTANVILNFGLSLKKSKIWIPSFELVNSFDKTSLFSYKDHFLKDVKPHSPKQNKALSCFAAPNYKRWENIIDLSKEKLEKVVLARRQSIVMEDDIDALSVFSKLKKKCENSFLFFYQPNPLEAFLGASPEMLFTKDKNQIISESIAGTRKRGQNQRFDTDLKKELITDQKELKEFHFVKDYIESIYKEICTHYDISKTDICETKWVQHLYTKFIGILKNNLTLKELLTLFHPTPAVCGTPKKQAFTFINNFEIFDRSFYAAPIGRASNLYSEFAVGIRSCYIKKNQIDVFAGTGIISSSNPKYEWKELQNKSDWIYEMI